MANGHRGGVRKIVREICDEAAWQLRGFPREAKRQLRGFGGEARRQVGGFGGEFAAQLFGRRRKRH
ncbi:MAG: hypothetical protein ACHQ9S_23500 [Candidatus Binatia bacterium]